MRTRLLSALAFISANIFAATNPVSVTHANTRFESSIVDGKLRESFWARKGTTWILIATSSGNTQGPLSIRRDGGSILSGSVTEISRQSDAVVEELRGDGWTAKRTLTGFGERNWIRISTELVPERPLTLHSFADNFRTDLKPDWSFSPSVGGFNPDAKYKAPLILVQSGSTAFGIVPDVLMLDRASLKRCNHALDLGIAGKATFSVGYIPAKPAYHSVFKEDLDRAWIAGERIANSYYLYVTADAAPREAYRDAVRFHWNEFGRQALSKAADEQAGTDPRYLSCHLWDEWRTAVWERESRDSWLTVPMPDGTTGGAVMMRRAHAPKPSVYFSAWFNSLRTAYGMALYARRTDNNDLMALAQQTLNTALKAPGHDGIFKCFAVPKDKSDTDKPSDVFWGAGDGSVVSMSSGYLGFDMSWTGYWLLKWREANLPGSETILARCVQLADFLIARQKPDGSLPTRFDESGHVQEELTAAVPAETAPVVRFLFELSKVEKNPKYLQAGLNGLAFLDKEVVPERKWYDFETFWSCSPRLLAFDERTRQWPANNLALIHAVAAYLQAYELTHQSMYLSKGQALLDYLLLYQQSWTNPALEELSGPFMLLGGFTTQNSDAEWSDARQSLAGEVILDYYRATHNAEYLERGVEALRSQFPISPSENWAHPGYGRKAGISSFHWGTGSGMAGIEFEEEYLRDAACDIPSKRCIGVNGLNITSWEIGRDGRIQLQMNSPYHWTRKPEIVFHGANANREYEVSVNGSQPQKFSAKQMETGIAVAMPVETHQTNNKETAF